MNLDELTGLPALPDGQWWEVRKYMRDLHLFGQLGSEAYEDGYEVCLMGKKFIPGTVTYGSHWWWSKPTYKHDRYEDGALFSKQITDPAKYERYASGRSLARHVGKQNIEPADVLKAALDIIDERDAADEAKARKAASDALIGAYPPMRLGVSV